MPTPRTSEFFDLTVLTPELQRDIQRLNTDFRATPDQILPEAVKLMLAAQPTPYSLAIAQARGHFTRQLDELDKNEKLAKKTLKLRDSAGAFESQFQPLAEEIATSGHLARQLAMQALKPLNTTWISIENESAADRLDEEESEGEPRSSVALSALVEFFQSMELSELKIAQARTAVAELRAKRKAFREYRKLEERSADAEKLRSRLGEIEQELGERHRRAAELRGLKPADGQVASTWIQLENEANQQAVIELEQAHEKLRKQCERQSLEMAEITAIIAAIGENARPFKIQELMMQNKVLRPLAKHWRDAWERENKLKDDLSAVLPKLREYEKLHADKERYKTKDIVSKVAKETNRKLETKDVTYHLENLSERGRIALKAPNKQWSLSAIEFDVAVKYISRTFRSQRKAEPKIGRLK